MLQLILIAAALAALFYFYAIKPMSFWREKGVKQTSNVWLFGDNWRTFLKLESFADMFCRVYNEVKGVRYFGMYQFTLPTLVLKDPELIKQIGVKDFDYFVDHRSFISDEGDPLFARNLFALKGQKWREMRPILSPSFTSSKMKQMFVLISECGKTFTDYFLNKKSNLIEVEMKDVFTRFTNDVIATSAFGFQINSLEKPNNEFYLMGKEATDLFGSFRKRMKFFGFLLFPKLYSLFKIGLFDKHIAKFFIELIENNMKTRKEKGIVRQDMLHLLMEAQKGYSQKEEEIEDNGFATVEESNLKPVKMTKKELTDLDICAQAMIFFFAGFETVSNAMCFMAHELAVNPDIQKKLRDEIEETLKECKGNVTYEALLKMKYMDMVVCETLRKWPSAIAGDRICTKPYTIQPEKPDEKPLKLEKGTAVWLPIYAIHRDPEFYPDPERFDPERFSDDNKANINPYAYLPFGVGPRNCIGNRFALLEIKIIMFQILSKFEIVPTAKTTIPIQISKKQFNLLAEGGFNLGFKRL